MLKQAVGYAQKGWRVLPVQYKGKIPALKDWVNKATSDYEQLKQWFAEQHNIGIATGKGSGFWVLDIDGEEGRESLRDLEQAYGELPETLTQITGSGGYHYLFTYDKRISTGTPRKIPGIDIRTDGNQIVVFPSIHPNGNRYEWELNDAKQFVPAPEWLIAELTKNNKDKKQSAAITEKIAPGERNHKLYRAACKYLDQGITGNILTVLMQEINKEYCEPMVNKEEVARIVESASKHMPTKELFPVDELPDNSQDVQLDKLITRPTQRANEYYNQSYNREGILGYKLGPMYQDLEKKLDGIQPGMYLVGAIANVGKTTWLLNLSKALIQSNPGLQVVMFSIDDHFRKIYYRLLAMEARMAINKVGNIGQRIRLTKDYKEEERKTYLDKVSAAKQQTDELLKDFILLDETDGNTASYIKQVVSKMHERNKDLIVIIDNFHKIRSPEINKDSRARFTYLSEEMKALCNRHDIPLIMTVELRKLNHDGPPSPDDLKETVDLHYDCDVTFMLHSESERKENSDKYFEIDNKTYPIIDIHVQKNKQSDFKGKMEFVIIPEKALYYELNYLKNTPEGHAVIAGCPF